MNHQAIVSNRPIGAVGSLLAHKPIFNSQNVVRKRVLVEQVSKLVERWLLGIGNRHEVSFGVFVIANHQFPINNPKRVRVIVAQLMPADFCGPAG